MVEIKAGKPIETVEKKGKVISAESERLKQEESNFKDFGQVDFKDHEFEEADKRYEKQNNQLDKFRKFR